MALTYRSRAVAIAAASDFFGVFMLKPSGELQSQIKAGTLAPIAEVFENTIF